jgi:hypothetical protein
MYSSIHSLTSALDGGEWSASCSCRFSSRERAPGTHWIGGWVDPNAILDAVVKKKFPVPAENRTLEPRSSNHSELKLIKIRENVDLLLLY